MFQCYAIDMTSLTDVTPTVWLTAGRDRGCFNLVPLNNLGRKRPYLSSGNVIATLTTVVQQRLL